MENARAGDAGAVKAGRHFSPKHNRDLPETQYPPCANERIRRLAGPRYERQIEHIHSLGPRMLAEMLAEVARDTGRPDIDADRVEEYAQLDPDLLRFLGGDRFAPNVVGVVKW